MNNYNLTISKRLKKIREYLKELKKFRNLSFKEYSENLQVQASAERWLQLSIEILIDIGTHLVVENEWGAVYVYRDLPEILYKQKILDDKYFKIFSDMIGFRNLLIHEYIEIDAKRVHEIIKNELNDIEVILKKLVDLL